MKRKISRRTWALIAAPLLLLLFVSCLYFIWHYLTFKRDDQRRLSCQTNLRQIWMATRQYSEDYGGKFPPVVIGGAEVKRLPPLRANETTTGHVGTPFGWADALLIYTKSTSLYMCPASPNPMRGSPFRSGYTNYWMNTNLSNQSMTKIAAPASTLFLGEGDDGTDKNDATYSKNAMPPLWLSDENSPAYRHLGGANYLWLMGAFTGSNPTKSFLSVGARTLSRFSNPI